MVAVENKARCRQLTYSRAFVHSIIICHYYKDSILPFVQVYSREKCTLTLGHLYVDYPGKIMSTQKRCVQILAQLEHDLDRLVCPGMRTPYGTLYIPPSVHLSRAVMYICKCI